MLADVLHLSDPVLCQKPRHYGADGVAYKGLHLDAHFRESPPGSNMVDPFGSAAAQNEAVFLFVYFFPCGVS